MVEATEPRIVNISAHCISLHAQRQRAITNLIAERVQQGIATTWQEGEQLFEQMFAKEN